MKRKVAWFVVAAGGLAASVAAAQQAAAPARQEGAPVPTVELKDVLPAPSTSAAVPAGTAQHIQGESGGPALSPTMGGDAGVASTHTGGSSQEKARRK